jgi:hypothetical protein
LIESLKSGASAAGSGILRRHDPLRIAHGLSGEGRASRANQPKYKAVAKPTIRIIDIMEPKEQTMMSPTSQTLTLTEAIRSLNRRDFDAALHPLTDTQRVELLAQCSWLQNALDRWRSAAIHAPVKADAAKAAKRRIIAELVA